MLLLKYQQNVFLKELEQSFYEDRGSNLTNSKYFSEQVTGGVNLLFIN